jgi:hypothetical protein
MAVATPERTLYRLVSAAPDLTFPNRQHGGVTSVPRPTHRSEFEPYPDDAAHADSTASVTAPRNDTTRVALAAAGDLSAWSELVDQLQPSVWAATGALGLPKAAAAQVCELAWLRLAQQLETAPLPLRPWMVGLVEQEASRWHLANTISHDDQIRLDEELAQPIITSD